MIGDGEISLDRIVHQVFHVLDLLRRHLLPVREVKPQALGRDVAAFLLHVLAENFPECRIQEVRRRVELGRLRRMIGEAAGELLRCSRAAFFLMLLFRVIE